MPIVRNVTGSKSSSPSGSDSERAEESFWLSRLDVDLPRAHLTPTLRRTGSAQRTYAESKFVLDLSVVRALKSLDFSIGVSDQALAVCLSALVFGCYARDDELTFGLQRDSSSASGQLMVPMRLSYVPNQTLREFLLAVTLEVNAVVAMPTEPLQRAMQVLQLEPSADRCVLFDVAIAVGGPGVDVDLQRYPVDIALVFQVDAGQIGCTVIYAKDAYAPWLIAQWISHFHNAARTCAANPSMTLSAIEILSPQELSQVTVEFNRNTANFPVHATMHALFEQQVQQHPDRVAVVHRNAQLTYAELNTRANRLSRTLIDLGLKRGEFVGVLLERSAEFVVTMLAVFKAGGAYVPLDPTYPLDRVTYMLEDCCTAFLITNSQLAEKYAEVIAQAPALTTLLSLAGDVSPTIAATARAHRPSLKVVNPDRISRAGSENVALNVTSTDRAYMIYTSGSTGRPKGAICRHDGALNHLCGELHGIGVSGPFRFLQTAASSSDISVWQFMAPLLFGGATVVADYDIVVDPVQLFGVLREHRITIAEPVPVVLRALLDHIEELPAPMRSLPNLHTMMCTGEALPGELVDRWLGLYPHIPVANTYGPTETSDDVTLFVMREPIAHRWAVAPIGHPLPNLSLFVLGRDLQPVPVGIPGEICIGGIGVGEGYWRQPEKTAAAFVPSPFPDLAAGSIYRTGDLGRWLPEGIIEFLGRIDNQVKVRGFRVEPGEIEGAMTAHPGVQDAAVIAVPDSFGNKKLVGYFVPAAQQPVSAVNLRQHLKLVLAEHMVPSTLIPLSALPLTPLGKMDRKALAKLDVLDAVHSREHVEARNDLERTLCAAWAKVLGANHVGVFDNFFEVGGDSISTIHVVSELARQGVRIAPKHIFLYPTIAELHTFIEQRGNTNVTIPHSDTQTAIVDMASTREALRSSYPDIENVYPLTATQRGIYFQSLLASKASGAYIEQIAFNLEGALDDKSFALAWQQTINDVDVLRTAVVRRGTSQPLQVVLRAASLVCEMKDMVSVPSQDLAAQLDETMHDERKRSFSLKTPPLMRVILVRLGESRWRVIWTYHHVILDGWSEPMVLRKVFAEYAFLTQNIERPKFAEARFKNFAYWSESLDLSQAEVFWRKELAGLTVPTRIEDRSPAITPSMPGDVSHGAKERSLSPEESAILEQFSRRNRLTLSTMIHGAWALVVHRMTGRDDVVMGSVASGRQSDFAEIEALVGITVVTNPVRSRAVPDATAIAWLRLLQLQMAEIREYSFAPLAKVQQWSELERATEPLFDALVVVGNYADSDLNKVVCQGLTLSNVQYETQPLFPLTVFVIPGASLASRLVYDKRKFSQGTIDSMLDEYIGVLRAIVENPEQRLQNLLQRHIG